MADSKITALTSISTSTDPANDPLVIVDVSDTSMAATGTTKKVTLNQLLGASGTATLASATITGDLTVRTNKLVVNATGVGAGKTPSYPLDVAGNVSMTGAGTGTRYLALMDETNTYAGSLTIQAGGGSAGFGGGIVLYGHSHATYPGAVWIGRSSTSSGPIMFGDYGTGPGNKFLQLDTGGVCTWYDGAGGTRMTLNATGLGVGVTPAGTGGCLQLKSGITFPATQVASSDANTLDDYEEGTWTPTVSATAGTLTTTTVNSATYTKIGRLVSVSVDISVVNIGTASGLLLFSLPTGLNQVVDSNVGAFRELGATGQMGQIFYQSATQVAVALYNNGTMIVNGYRFRGAYTYTTAT